MCLTFREDFTSVNRNRNLNSRTKLLSQLICMKLIGQLKQQLLTYMSVAEIWNRWTLNNFIFLLKITGKFHYMSEEKVANHFHLKFLWLHSSFLKAQEKQTCLYVPFLYFIPTPQCTSSSLQPTICSCSMVLYMTAVYHRRFKATNKNI